MAATIRVSELLDGHVGCGRMTSCLRSVFSERHDRDLVGRSERVHRPAEAGTDLLHDRRRGDLVTQVPAHEADHLATDCNVGTYPFR
jgi:hypothetical protein